MLEAVLVGCGAMSRAWLEAARQIDGLSLVGLVDIDVSRARSRAAEFGLDGVAIGGSLDAILEQTKPAVVFDVVVPSARPAVASSAFKHGCHLLSEKPLAPSLEEAHAMIAAARDAGRIHAVVQNRRYIAPVRRIRRLIDSGTIGKPTSIHCDFFLAPHFGGFREEMDHVLLLDMAIHTFDTARAVTGLEGHRVYCHEWNPANSWYRHGASAAAIFDMSAGVVFVYRGSWCADGARTSWEAAWRIVGERGTLVWDGHDAISVEVVADDARDGLFDQTRPVEVPPLHDTDAIGGHLAVMKEFVTAVGGGPLPETVSTDNLNSLAMVFGAIRSAESGQAVAIEDPGRHA